MSNRRREYGGSGYEVKKFISICRTRINYNTYNLRFYHADHIEGPWSYIGEDGLLTNFNAYDPNYTTISAISIHVIDDHSLRIVYGSTFYDVDLSSLSVTNTGSINGYLDYILCIGTINKGQYLYTSTLYNYSVIKLYDLENNIFRDFIDLGDGHRIRGVCVNDNNIYVISTIRSTQNTYDIYTDWLHKYDLSGNFIKSANTSGDYSRTEDLTVEYCKHTDRLLICDNYGGWLVDTDLNFIKQVYRGYISFEWNANNAVFLDGDPHAYKLIQTWVYEDENDETGICVPTCRKINTLDGTYNDYLKTYPSSMNGDYYIMNANCSEHTPWNDVNSDVLWYDASEYRGINRKFIDGKILDAAANITTSITEDGINSYGLSGTNIPGSGDIYIYLQMHD